MGSESANLKERLKSLIAQLKTESGILDRIVYKGKNQHRRCLYFQYLLKVNISFISASLITIWISFMIFNSAFML